MTSRTLQILEDLEAVRENLLALSDDIWLSIDHNDGQALEEGVEFKRAYNEKLAAFDALATGLSVLVQQFTSVRLEAGEQTGAEDEAENARIVRELNREEPHAIDEDFTFKRPHGYILQGQGASGITPGAAFTSSSSKNCYAATRSPSNRSPNIPTSSPTAAIISSPATPAPSAPPRSLATRLQRDQPLRQRPPRRSPSPAGRVRDPGTRSPALPPRRPRRRAGAGIVRRLPVRS